MNADYNIFLVAISIIIAITASYSALNIAAKISNAEGKSKLFWLIAGSIVMGAGVWSMHFIGMLAYRSHSMVDYDVLITILSMLASVFSSFLAFFITMPKAINKWKIACGGGVMGAGIVTMHYLGMKAMIMDAEMMYDPGLVTLSVVIALCASYAALLLFVRFRHDASSTWLKWGAAIIMGIAISGMHYTAMSATTFQMTESHVSHGGTDYAPDTFLLFGVIGTIFLIIMVSWVAMFFDRFVLEKMAFQDNVTGLANRNEMIRYFRKQPIGKKIAVLFLDLDQFKAINDTLGHEIGDLLLMEVGAILRKFESHSLRAYRIGGDEFLFISEYAEVPWMEKIADDILKEINLPIRVDGNELYVTGSIGIAEGTISDVGHTKLLRTADTAMYIAKRKGKNQYCVYTEEMGVKEVRRMELEKDLPRALEDDQFHLEYQPKWNVKTNSLYGFEALIRWDHPRLGVVPPIEFIPVAEENGIIVSVTKWTLETACKQCYEWSTHQGLNQPVAVNVSPSLFQTGTLYELIKHALDQSTLDPDKLEIEITESMMLHDVEDIIRQLNRIRQLGVKVSMDDFGTGYSSIGLLDTLPINAVKLDRIFTQDIEKPSKQAIIQAIIVLAESLDLDVVAEGVELEKDIDYLMKLGCFVMQGYYYSKPMKFEHIDEWASQREASLIK
ncbi:bifunctional diguanylate cyclase/phosphodiesterase [Gracilibacillus salinarum]|uniref:EAL domain-containing protein n=1 Tax=Gracilibacillus salinarum TaxID=2932255 RepID=A0ABY4GRH2_9BACI|nr:bifunctional diguanylate cyclase/phosphodiesterase [Gracilibacillus salinarum]UOQ86874.1 EAL domain-containing protein [Gracilibacillus salinarum]